MTITDILNLWNELGVFSYAIPFLLIFAIVYAILEKSHMLSDPEHPNRPVLAIVSAAIGLLALQFDFVSEFYAVIFPRFGIGLAVFLVLLIVVGFFHPTLPNKINKPMATIAWIVGVGVVIWALSAWDQWNDYSGFGGWFSDYIWSLLILGGIIGAIVAIAKSEKFERSSSGGSNH